MVVQSLVADSFALNTQHQKAGEFDMSAPNYPLRLDPLRRAGWKRAAELEGRTLAGWIKRVCDQAAEQVQSSKHKSGDLYEK